MEMANPFMCNYNEELDSLVDLIPSDFETSLQNVDNEDSQLLVPTSNIHVAYSIIQPWLENKQHVLVAEFNFKLNLLSLFKFFAIYTLHQLF